MRLYAYYALLTVTLTAMLGMVSIVVVTLIDTIREVTR